MLRAVTPARSLLFLVFISCILLLSMSARYDLLDGQSARQHLVPRQLQVGPQNPPGGGGTDPGAGGGGTTPGGGNANPPGGGAGTGGGGTTPGGGAGGGTAPGGGAGGGTTPGGGTGAGGGTGGNSNPPGSGTTASGGNSNPSGGGAGASDSSTSTTSTSTTSTSASTTSTPTPTPTPTPSPDPSPATTPSDTVTTPFVTNSIVTGADGEKSTVFVTVNPDPTTTPTNTAAADNSGKSKGVGTSTIVGLSVAGGVAVICIIAFIVWKFTRKRFSDDFDDNEGIKWPELNTHGDNNPHALPTNRTGNSGFETTSEVNLTRSPSHTGSFAPSTSEVNLYAANQDPYAVPPPPHLNPNQPYHDDPALSFYDPYNGPVPQTFTETPHDGEAIPMTQINRGRSPGPGVALDNASMRARSPGPVAGYEMMAGRASPGPQAGLAMDPRARSPGPGAAYGGRSASPAPQAAYGYGGYGGAPTAGRVSPGPHQAYGGN